MTRAALTLVVLALAGCGGGAGTPATGQKPPDAPTGLEAELAEQNAYDDGLDTCSQYPLKELAETYRTKPKPEAVAREVGKRESSPALREAARKGCLAAFE